MTDELYDDAFYDANESGSYRSAGVVLGLALSILAPSSVLDVGCGVGTWLRAARDNGATDLLGIDGDYVDRRRFHVDAACFAAADLTDPEALPAVLGDRRFDIALCLETAEHLPTSAARPLVKSLANASNVILWSAALPGQGGTNHVNERPLTYWATLWHEAGYVPLDVLRPGLQFASIEVWYSQNALLFVAAADAGRIQSAFSAHYTAKIGFVPPLAFMHPTAVARWLGLPRSEVSRRLDRFGIAFIAEFARQIGLSEDDMERFDVRWEGDLYWFGVRPRGAAGVQPACCCTARSKPRYR